MMNNRSHNTHRQFWVIGGEYTDTAFRELRSPPHACGPFPTYEEAHRAWQNEAGRTRSDACTRYTIAATPAQL